MKAMILAAGLGTRLKPWTIEHPKALVPVGGEPMLKRVILRLKHFGFDYIVVNVHHFADQIINYLNRNDFGVEIRISDESDCLLDTGGGLIHALPLLEQRPGPTLLHNVDILSNAPLDVLMKNHVEQKSDVSLLVSNRESSRLLGFDSNMNLLGRINKATGQSDPLCFSPEQAHLLRAFSGIYIMGEKALEALNGFATKRTFPIMDFLLSPDHNVEIRGIDIQNMQLLDIGKPDTLAAANAHRDFLKY